MIFLVIIINLLNLSSTNNHYLTTYMMPSLVMETSVHYQVFYKILIPIRVHLQSPLLLKA